MIIIDALSLLLLVALPVTGSDIKFNRLDTFRNLDLITHATTRDIDVHGKTEEVNERQFVEKEARLARDSGPSTPSALTSVKPNRLQHERTAKSNEKDVCGLHARNHFCNDLFSLFSSNISSSVSSAISSKVSRNDASIITSLAAAVQTASEEGFRDGQSKASESAQRAIDSAKSSASSVVDSIFSAVHCTSSAVGTIPSVVGNWNGASHGLIIDAGQLAGIVVGVFFVSSVLSVLATLFFLWYRRRKTGIAHNTRHFPVEEKNKILRRTLGKLRGNFFSSSSAASRTAGRHDLCKIFTPELKHGKPSQSQQGISSVNRIPFASPISPGLNSDRIFPVSPLSNQPPDSSGRDSSPSLGLGLYGSRTQISSGSEASGVPPIGFTLIRNPTQPETLQIPVIRMGGQETNPGRLLSNMWTTQTFQSNESPVDFTDLHEEPNIRDAANRMEEGMVTLTPIADRGALSPPIIPLRFSSLNAQKGPSIQRSVDSHGNGETFLLSTDEESADRDPEFSQDRSGLRSPSPSPSHSSIISQDLTQFDPGGLRPQPTSRFSMSSAPPSSLGYSASSSSPAPHYHQQQQEHPEINPLRPAPPSPSQLQSPVPRRPNAAANLASLEPPTHGDS
ncbi:hypothetical protein F5B21DRAFT_521665 [Xylaria acuta]|nr:hypothetical protein F5B21DRAFT_521665 [Xylaria acuta]